jgi:hypothetical protein
MRAVNCLLNKQDNVICEKHVQNYVLDMIDLYDTKSISNQALKTPARKTRVHSTELVFYLSKAVAQISTILRRNCNIRF